jgi:hypothetical protein
MLVRGIVKGDGMFDWHSEYTVIQARQREMVDAARLERLLAAAGGSAGSGVGRRPRGPARRPARKAGGQGSPSLRYRLGAALVLLGQRLQGGDSQLPAASG